MSDLRTRIAGVIAAHGFAGYDPEDSYTNANWPCSCDWVGRTAPEYQQHVADAVIAALQIQPEYGHLDETDSGIIADTIPELGEPCPGETLRHRYITPWKDINETD
jgi:hypothetical protein